jgi:hypothetical protein
VSTFRGQLDADMTGVFLNSDEFAESVTWLAKSGPAEGVTIKALVNRGQLTTRPTDGGRVLSWDIAVTVAASVVGTVNRNGDKVRVAEFSGGTTFDYRVSSIIKRNPTSITLGLSK